MVQSQQGRSSGSGGANPVPDLAVDGGPGSPPEPPLSEDVQIGLIERAYHDIGVKREKQEAKTLSKLVGSLGADYKSEIPVNNGLCFSLEQDGLKPLKLHKETDVETLYRRLEENKPKLVLGLPPEGPFAAVTAKLQLL